LDYIELSCSVSLVSLLLIIDVPRAIRLIRKNLAQVTRTARARAGDWHSLSPWVFSDRLRRPPSRRLRRTPSSDRVPA
jgi:hypothetical protein